MWIGAGLARIDFALLSRPGATSRATNTQSLFLFSFHNRMMKHCPAIIWSILTVIGFSCLVNFDQSASPLSFDTDKRQTVPVHEATRLGLTRSAIMVSNQRR
jgi:hypothetical protein